MTTNTAAEIAAIRERADAMQQALLNYSEMTYLDPGFQEASDMLDIARFRCAADVPVLLAHVAVLTARAEAAEADYRTLAAQVARIDSAGDVQIDDLEVSYGEMCDDAQVRLTALMAVATMAGIHDRRVREAADALAAHAANGESAGNGGA